MRLGWCTAAGRIVERIGSDGFPAALAAGLRELVAIDFVVAFGYPGSSRPLDLYDDFPDDRRRLHVEEYLEGPYLLDPFFLASLDQGRSGLWRLREIAPDRFYQGEYFRNYYVQTGLSEEIGYLVDVNPGLTVVVSLMRTDRRFTAAEVRTLGQVWPVVAAASRRHWQDLPLTVGEPSTAIRQGIEQAFRTIGAGILTPRERQVVEHTLRGHSAEAAGRILGISPGTVRIHRRNIYSKLRISSQGELFSHFITAMLGPSEPRSVRGGI